MGDSGSAVDVRASDVERDATVAALVAACVAGRITLDELEARVARAISSRTVGDLSLVVDDLPNVRLTGSHDKRLGRIGGLGPRPFELRRVVPADRGTVRRDTLDKMSPALRAYGFKLVDYTPSGLVFERTTERSRLAVVAAILLFPMGLIGLAFTSDTATRVVVSLQRNGPDETLMAIAGIAPRPVRKAFAALT